MMDDYLVPGSGADTNPAGRAALVHCDAEAHYSCRRFAWQEIQDVFNQHLPQSRQVPTSQVWFPDPSDPQAYDARLQLAGGIDLFLIASGASDGHVAFNPPGSDAGSVTRIIQLSDSTRRDNMATFPEFQDLSQVPSHGVSVGLATIAALSQRVWLVMHGQGKRFALEQLARRGEFSTDWPVSIVFNCRNPKVVLDEAAIPEISRPIGNGNEGPYPPQK
jgi:glucosamine-6-phosphate deaminase